AERLERGAPLIVAAGRPARVAFATPAALALFGVETLGALDAVALAARSPGARRLRHLAEALAQGIPPRMESLRFYAGRLPLPVGLMCARIASSQGRDFLVMATPPTPSEAEPPALAVAEPTAGEAPRVEIAPTRRFLWSLDAQNRFARTDGALQEAVGSYAPNVGESLAALCARVGLDPTGDLAQAIAARRTFSALRLGWPEPDRASARIALMSGAPIFDKERRFAGFRGFGLFTGETIPCQAAERTPAEISPPAAEALAGAVEGPAEPPMPEASVDSRGEETAGPGKLAWPPQPGDRTAEIVVLRQPGPGQAGGPNVVPIRPGALSALSLLPDESRRSGDERESVELTTNERDAFREIARALGAKLPSQHEEKPAGAAIETSAAPLLAPPAARDLIDVAEPPCPAPPERAREAPIEPASESARRNACALLDRLPIGAMVLRGGEPLYLNQTMLDLVGYRDLADLRAADGLAHMFRGRDAQMLAEASEGGAMPLVTAGGELIAVDGQAQSVQWDGAPATLIALRRSRDAEYQAELRALEREARAHEAAARDLMAVLDAAADGVVALDAAGRIVSMSRPAEALFGYEQNEAAGESFLMLFAPQSQSEAASRFERVKHDEANASAGAGEELVGRDRRGQSIPLLLTMARLGAPQSPSRYYALVRDVTRWKAIERTLETALGQAEKASARKTDFLARISHEVRTPLHAILGFAEVMMEERFGPIGNERYKDYIKDIHASAKHVMSLANDLLDLSKIEAGKLELEFAPVDANRIIRECVSLMQPQAAQERIIMRLALFDKLPNVMADERSLRQILLNLMSNAVKFNEPGGQVIVSTALDEAGHSVIRVRDTGVGMNESEITAALEPFRQVGGARRAGGAGLGLPLTKALAEANRADFSIKSRKQQGTLVEVAFPSAKAAQ
ncbi:MAG TPA: PAS domain-containing sensor histidine kinase, partial [Roseiarcus sp.]|nr:PAS domain-containing sensor histidine kinase [Roseiarcus sp.]